LEIKVAKLKEVMELVKPVVPKKPTVKSIACICMGGGKAVATDLETMVIANLPEGTEPINSRQQAASPPHHGSISWSMCFQPRRLKYPTQKSARSDTLSESRSAGRRTNSILSNILGIDYP